MVEPAKAADKQAATNTLRAARAGNRAAAEHLVGLVYEDLRRAARRLLAGERADHTLQPTALVHEAYLRLIDVREADWQDRAYFVASAIQAMRRVLIDHARRRRASKRGSGQRRITLVDTLAPSHEAAGVLEIDEVLTRLASQSERRAEIASMRIFGGLSAVELAEVLGVSKRTVEREWRLARAWLIAELRS